jgi:hypothetical protein
MSQSVPVFVVGDHVRIMQTDWATERQLENKIGRVTHLRGPFGDRLALVHLFDTAKIVEVPDSCLMHHELGQLTKAAFEEEPPITKRIPAAVTPAILPSAKVIDYRESIEKTKSEIRASVSANTQKPKRKR